MTRGVVTRIVQQGKRTGLEIGGQWYSLFEPCDLSEGDLVEFDYTVVKRNGKTYHNIQTIKRLAAPTNEWPQRRGADRSGSGSESCGR
ncbi:MAG: hypothetical protein QXS68_06595 [Candidatus Methanomethylicaceae archaeon]